MIGKKTTEPTTVVNVGTPSGIKKTEHHIINKKVTTINYSLFLFKVFRTFGLISSKS